MNRIVRIIFIALLAVLPAELSSQNTSPIERLYDSFASNCVAIDCTYEIDSGGLTTKGQCQVEVQGTLFKMQGAGLDVYCDGQSVWALDVEGKEAIVESAGEDSFSYMTNPALLFRDMDKVFTISGSSSIATSVRYVLSPRKSCGIKNAVLHIGNDAALRDAEFILDDESLVKINVRSYKVLPLKQIGYFSPSALSSDWVVTDLRSL